MKGLKALLCALALTLGVISPVLAANTDVPSAQAVRTPDTVATGSLAAANAAVTINPVGLSAVNVGISGTFSATLTFEASVDGTNFYAVSVVPISGGTSVQTTTATGAWQGVTAGFASFRVRVSSYTSGTASVTVRAGGGTGGIVCISGCSSSGSGSTTVTYNTSAPTLTNGSTAPLQGDVNGNLKVTQAGAGVTSSNPLYSTDPNNNQIAQDGNKNQGVYIAGSGQGATSTTPLYSTDPNVTSVNQDINKNLIVVGTGPNSQIGTILTYQTGVELEGSASVSTTAVSISMTNAYYKIDLWNTGTVAAYCNLSATATAALTGGILLPSAMSQPYTAYWRTSGASTVSCITSSGTTTIQAIAYR